MDPLNLIGLQSLMSISNGDPSIVIGIIDGPIDLNHPAFQSLILRPLEIRNLMHVRMLIA